LVQVALVCLDSFVIESISKKQSSNFPAAPSGSCKRPALFVCEPLQLKIQPPTFPVARVASCPALPGFLQEILPTQNTKLQLSAAPGVAQRTQPCLILRKRVPPSRKYELTFLCGFVARASSSWRSVASESLQLENTKSNLSCGLQVVFARVQPCLDYFASESFQPQNTGPNFPAVSGSGAAPHPALLGFFARESLISKKHELQLSQGLRGVAPRAHSARSVARSPSISENTKLQLPVVLVWSASSLPGLSAASPFQCNTKLQSCCSSEAASAVSSDSSLQEVPDPKIEPSPGLWSSSRVQPS
jgi:hypothetical protein